MNITETGALLAKIQAFDNRTVDEAVILAWQEILEPHTFQDCSSAVARYYRRSAKWIMPSHVVELVEEIESGRLRAVKVDIHLSDRDSEKLMMGEFPDWSEQMRKLRRLVATGKLAPTVVETYINDNLELSTFAPLKELTQ